MVVVNSKAEETFRNKDFLTSFVAKFDEKYAQEEEADFEETLRLFSRGFRHGDVFDSSIKVIEYRLAYQESYGKDAIDSAMSLRAGLMAYHDTITGNYYVGLLRSEYKDLFDILYHKLFMEKNQNKFMEIKRLGKVPNDFTGVYIELLKDVA